VKLLQAEAAGDGLLVLPAAHSGHCGEPGDASELQVAWSALGVHGCVLSGVAERERRREPRGLFLSAAQKLADRGFVVYEQDDAIKSWFTGRPPLATRTYGPPRLQEVLCPTHISCNNVSGLERQLGQDGESRVTILIIMSASTAIW
jgi:hypothetical protein